MDIHGLAEHNRSMTDVEKVQAEFEREAGLTRRVIERIPPDKLEWRPHAKSTTFAGLARHLAHMISWGTVAFEAGDIELSQRPPMPSAETIEDVLRVFDENAAKVRAALARCADRDLKALWTLSHQGKPLVSMTKGDVVQTMVVHHMIHHRGQLSVYLRLNDVPVPSIYGPTADEPMSI